jgi:hypothetical protein
VLPDVHALEDVVPERETPPFAAMKPYAAAAWIAIAIGAAALPTYLHGDELRCRTVRAYSFGSHSLGRAA